MAVLSSHNLKLTDDLVGRGFKQGSRGPDSYDCFGLAAELIARTGYILPEHPTAESLIMAAAMIERKESAYCRPIVRIEPWCLLLFEMADGLHLGVAMEDTRYMIHCSKLRGGVRIEKWRKYPWAEKLHGFYKCTMRVGKMPGTAGA